MARIHRRLCNEFQCLGHSNWPFKPILFCNLSNSFIFILWNPILLPQRDNNEKGEFFQLPIWMRQEGFQCLGHPYWTICSPLSQFCSEIFPSSNFHIGPFLLPQRANFGSWENFPFTNMGETEGIECLGHSNWTICSPLSPFCSEIFSTFSLSYWEPILITPEG